MLRLLILFALSLLCSATHRALLIGIGGYPKVEDQLKGPKRDVANMKAVALRLGYKPGEIMTLIDEEATCAAIIRAIEQWLIQGTGPEDHALFYYSGHGAQIPDQEPFDEADGKDEVLVPWDFVRVRPVTNRDPGLKRVVTDDQLNSLLTRIPSQNLSVILDSCFSGGGLKGMSWTDPDVRPKLLPEDSSGRLSSRGAQVDIGGGTMRWNRQVRLGAILASREDEVAQDTPAGGRLTLAIVDAIQRSSNPTLEGLYQAADTTLAAQTGGRQHPQLGGNPVRWRGGLAVVRSSPEPAPGMSAGHGSEAFRAAGMFIRSAPRRVAMQVAKSDLIEKELLQLSATVSVSGYLTILNVAEDSDEVAVLFPNSFVTDNHVIEGQVIRIPSGNYTFPAKIGSSAKVQRNLTLALFSSRPLQLAGQDLTKVLHLPALTREYEIRADQGEIVAAGGVITTIRKSSSTAKNRP